MLRIISMVISILMYAFTGKMIFAWLTIMAGLAGILLTWVYIKEEEKQHIEDLVQKCIEDLKNGGDC